MRPGFYILISVLCSCASPAKKTGNEEKPKAISQRIEHVNRQAKVADYDTVTWTEITADENIKLDIRYATTNNFTGQQIYNCPRCFLRKETAVKLYLAAAELTESGYGLILFDCYRPHPAQEKLWKIVPNPAYVADPKTGSMHNRGLAIDLTLSNSDGEALSMGTTYDHFGPEAHHGYLEFDDQTLMYRRLLKETMSKYGLKHISSEWWHYSDISSSASISSFEWNCE